jgi:hypothetical protein
MRSVLKIGTAVAASIGLLASSTATVAAAPAQARASYQAPNAWVMLSVLGSANAAAQPTDVPPPPPGPPPPPPVVEGGAMDGGFGELLPIVLWFGLIAVALAVSDDGGRSGAIGNPNSPT